MRACPNCKTDSVIEDGYCGQCRQCTLQPSVAAPICSVERTSRSVIEHKLLTALEDGGVAAILSKQDLEDLVFACKLWSMRDARATRLGNLQRGMEQLLSEAFPPNNKLTDAGTKTL